MKTIRMAVLIVFSSMLLAGCTTCDLALWLGSDVCEIGGA